MIKTTVRLVIAWALLLLSSVSVGIVGQQAEPNFGGSIRVGIESAMPTLDWQIAGQSIVAQLGHHIWERLVTFDAQYQIIPDLAESWEVNEDRTVYTFHLRKGVQFHKGYGEMTAEDVKASLERYKLVPGGHLLNVVEIEIVDLYTIALHLDGPAGPVFLKILATETGAAIILPKEVVEPTPGDYLPAGEVGLDEAVGTGPFELVDWRPGERLVLARFDDYTTPDFPSSGFGGARVAYLDEVILVPIPETSARVSALLAGDIDFAVGIPLTSLPQLMGETDIAIYPIEPYWIPAAYFNLARGPMSDVRIRLAVYAAADCDAIMRAAARGYADFYKTGCGTIFFQDLQPQWHSTHGCESGLFGQGHQPEKARALLEDAGYDGTPIRILASTDYFWMYQSALVLAEQMGRAGFNTTLEVLDWPGLSAKRGDLGAWDIYWTGTNLRFDPSQHYFGLDDRLDYQYYQEYEWPEMRALIDKDMTATTEEERYPIWQDIMRLFVENATTLHAGELKGASAGRADLHYDNWFLWHFWNAWLEGPDS